MGDAELVAGAIALAAVAAAGGFLLGRSRLLTPRPRVPQGPAPDELMAGLLARAALLDILPDGGGEPIARCLPKSADADGLACDLLGGAAPAELVPGRSVTCLFAPVRQDGRKVNAFASVIAAVRAAQETPQLVLAPPRELVAMPRRRHARKRVSDPRFVNLRLWAADPEASRLNFPETAPDIWINAYGGQGDAENAVTDISPGGLAMEVRAGLVPPGLSPGSPVVLKCSLFQFKEKQFRPYWYAGQVRALGDPGGRTRRISIGFTRVGVLDATAPQGVRWTERIANETQGGIA